MICTSGADHTRTEMNRDADAMLDQKRSVSMVLRYE